MNIYQRINKVREVVAYIKKDTKVNNRYTAVTHDAVLAALRPALIEQGIVMVPVLLTERTAVTGKATSGGTPIIRHETVYRVEFVNMDEPSEKVCVEIASHADDEGDKAPGKAVSYAVKYAELKLFNIETGDNDEARVEAVPINDALSNEAVRQFADAMKAALVNDDHMAAGRLIYKHSDLYEVANNKTAKTGGYFTAKDKLAFGEMNTKYHQTLQEWADAAIESASQDDEHGVREIIDDIDDSADKKLLWQKLDGPARVYITALKEAA